MINRADIFPSRAIRLGGQKLIRNSAGGALLLAVLVGAYLVFGPKYVSRGFADIPLLVLGKSYGAYVSCNDTSAVQPSLLKAFIGIQEGQRVMVRGYLISDARQALESAFPGCRISAVTRARQQTGISIGL